MASEKTSTEKRFQYVYKSRPIDTFEDLLLKRQQKTKTRQTKQQSYSPPINPKCGHYQRDQILEGYELVQLSGAHEFKFKIKIINEKQQAIMNATPTIKSSTRHVMYASNPYKSDLYTVKLYKRDLNLMNRAFITDLYCHHGHSLSPKCDLTLIDTGEKLTNISYDNIYEFPQIINYLADEPPEIKCARLPLTLDEETKVDKSAINEHFLRLIEEKGSLNFAIKVLDFKEETYDVDLIDKDGKSITSILSEKFPRIVIYKIQTRFESILSFTKVEQPKCRRSTNGDANPGKPNYYGASAYFMSKLASINPNDISTSYLSKRLFKIKIVDKSDPSSLSIIPADPEFVKDHSKFRAKIDQLPSAKEGRPRDSGMVTLLEPGDMVMFKPRHHEPQLGLWLRGIVVRRSNHNMWNHCTGPTEDGKNMDVHQLVRKGFLSPEDVKYSIRSIDYGFHSCCNHLSIRRVIGEELTQFIALMPWSMRCNIYGVHPYENEDILSESCLDMIDCWIRERSSGNNPNAYYKVLFRDNIVGKTRLEHFRNSFPVSVFHREEPVYSKGPIKTPYSCLNTFLIDRGLATDTLPCGGGVSSKVMLDEHIINVLVRHGRV